jgi:hypothetical protein
MLLTYALCFVDGALFLCGPVRAALETGGLPGVGLVVAKVTQHAPSRRDVQASRAVACINQDFKTSNFNGFKIQKNSFCAFWE